MFRKLLRLMRSLFERRRGPSVIVLDEEGRVIERREALMVPNPFLRLIDKAKIVIGLSNITPSSSTPDYVSLKDYKKLTAIIIYNNATSVTGSAITLKQATAVAGTGEKALAFTSQWANTDISANDTLTETTVTSNTFTTDDTDNKDGYHVIEVDASDLDVANNFDCVRVGTGDATATVLTVVYILHPGKHMPAIALSAITD